MTVIAWDGKTIAADRQSTCGDMVCLRTKLERVLDTTIVATAGDTDRGLMLKKWVREGSKPEEWPAFQRTPDFAILVVATNGKVFEYNQEPIGIQVESPFMAWGSGSAYAMGAMAMGATAAQAVEAACQCCTSCGLGVDSLEVLQ